MLCFLGLKPIIPDQRLATPFAPAAVFLIFLSLLPLFGFALLVVWRVAWWCGVCVDRSIGFASIPDRFSAAFLLVLLSCVLWNVGVFIVLAPRMFPNFWWVLLSRVSPEQPNQTEPSITEPKHYRHEVHIKGCGVGP